MFSNPEVVRRINAEFVPYAGDQWYLHRQKDADGEYFWKVAQQGHNRNRPPDTTRQGLYVATADGTLLGSDPYHSSLPRFFKLLDDSLKLARSVRSSEPPSPSGTPDRRFDRRLPPGVLVLNSFTRIPLDSTRAGRWTHNEATGRDHVWITKAEASRLRPQAWRRGEAVPVPLSVAERLLRFHLVDNVRGEPPFWAREHIRASELTLTVEDVPTRKLRLQGSARLQSHDGSRGYEARIQGLLQMDPSATRWTRFDVLSWGEAWGSGPYTPGAPPGRFPLLIAFTLAGGEPADRVPPQGARDLAEYLAGG